MKRRRKRRCCGCKELFHPKPQTRHKQRFCGKAECRRLSAKSSQQKWVRKNPEHFKGGENVIRVQRWRKKNPGYWRRRKGGLRADALQDQCIVQVPESEPDNVTLERIALQEEWFLQPLIIIGLIAHLSEITLQEEIVNAAVNLRKRGREILGTRPGNSSGIKTQIHNEKENHQCRSDTPCTRSL